MHTHAHRSPNNSSLHLEPRHALTLSSPCSHSHTVRGYKLTMLYSSWRGAGSNHAKGWCVSLHYSILHSLVFTLYTAYSTCTRLHIEEIGGASERGGVGGKPGDDGSERAMPGCDDGLKRERSDGPSKSGARCAAVQLPYIELVPPRARRCTTTWFFYSYCFFFVLNVILLLVRRASSARASERGDFGSERGR